MTLHKLITYIRTFLSLTLCVNVQMTSCLSKVKWVYRGYLFVTLSLHKSKNNVIQSNHPLPPSFCSSIFLLLPGVGSRWQQAQAADPDFPFNISQLILGDVEVFPGQQRNIIPPACPGSSPRSPTSWACSKNLQWEASRRHPS